MYLRNCGKPDVMNQFSNFAIFMTSITYFGSFLLTIAIFANEKRKEDIMITGLIHSY